MSGPIRFLPISLFLRLQKSWQNFGEKVRPDITRKKFRAVMKWKWKMEWNPHQNKKLFDWKVDLKQYDLNSDLTTHLDFQTKYCM